MGARLFLGADTGTALAGGLPSLLIEREELEAKQMALFSLPAAVEAELDRQQQYTAERLFLRRPDTYRTIVFLLQQGQSVRAIKKACAVHHLTVLAVSIREKIAIDTGKEGVVAQMRVLQTMLVESLTDAVVEGRLKPEAMGVALGIVSDKIELLSGGATVRVETTQAGSDGPRTWDEYLAKLKGAAPDRTGLGEGENEQRPARVHCLDLPAADSESAAHMKPPASATASDTDQPAEEPEPTLDALGGGGGAPEAGGLPRPIDQSP